MNERTITVAGVAVPRFLYGTAWKEDETARLTTLAIEQGFRGIDTACQRKHYHEAGVGEAIRAAMAGGVVTRDDLFIQTKFTFAAGQDRRLPYDPKAPVADQVSQSFRRSLENLGVDVVESYVLHGPSRRDGLGARDWAAWRAMEEIHRKGGARLLGVSNVNLAQLQALAAEARVMPRFVQNRCYASRGWDRDVRRFAAANGIHYQGFSLLTANRQAVAHPTILGLAQRHGRTPSQIVFRFALDIGMVALTGTTSAQHMAEDLDVYGFALDADEVAVIEALLAP